MEGVKALVVLASIYYPGDGIVAKNNYQTSSGERYDQSAPKCAALQWSLGTMLHLVHGRNNIDVTINDHGPYRRGRALDCTPAVDKALHLGGLGSVRVEHYPPLPKARPVEAQVAALVGDPMEATVKPPTGYDADRSLHPLPSVEHYPPLPKARPVEVQVATLVGQPMDATVKPLAELKGWVDPHLKASEPKKTVRLPARRPLTQRNPQHIQPFWQVSLP